MSLIKFAVIGCGNIGKRHLAVIDAEERAELVGACDIVPERAQSAGELYNVPAFENYEELIRTCGADVVSICTPHGLHAEMSIAVAQSGTHVLVEKPMALTTSDCEAMIRAAAAHDVSLMVVKQNRYNRPIGLVREALANGRLGKVYLVQCNVLWNRHTAYYSESNWKGRVRLEGGALFTQVVHFIDLMIWWFGDVVSAQTIVDTMKHDIEIEDTGSANLEFSSGVLGSLTWTTCVYNKNFEGSITIVGDKGTVRIGGEYLNTIDFWDIESYPLPKGIQFTDTPNIYSKYQGSSSNHPKVVEDVVANLLHERHDVVEGDEGIKSIAAIEKIYAAAGR